MGNLEMPINQKLLDNVFTELIQIPITDVFILKDIHCFLISSYHFFTSELTPQYHQVQIYQKSLRHVFIAFHNEINKAFFK